MTPSRRGLSLIEILVVIALLGLVLVLILVSLSPGDDQRVRKEAERLAAYLTGASAEALMRDGPVRVAFELDDQRYVRESARIGADVGAPQWSPDAKVKGQSVTKPVKLTVLDLPIAGELSSGQGWMIWDGVRTGGGVAVLEYNESMWSVVVDPRSGEIDVVRGRGRLPERAVARGSRFSLGDDALSSLSGPGSDALELPEVFDYDGGLPPIAPIGDPDPLPEDYDSDLPYTDLGFDTDYGLVDYGLPLEEEEEDPLSDAGVDETPDASVGCATDLDCKDPQDPSTTYHRCLLPKGQQGGGTCYFDPGGTDWRINSLSVTAPGGAFAETLSLLMGGYINQGQMNVVFSFPSAPSYPNASWDGPVATTQLGALVAQAQSNGASFSPNFALPSFKLQPQGVNYCEQVDGRYQGGCSYTFTKVDLRASETLGRVELYFPGRKPRSRQACYVRLILPSDSTQISLNISYNGTWEADVTFDAALTVSDADATEIPASSIPPELMEIPSGEDFVSLRDLLKNFDLGEPLYDINQDGVKDAWRFTFQGKASITQLVNREALEILVDKSPSQTCSDD